MPIDNAALKSARRVDTLGNMSDDWRKLRVNDRIRFVHMPTEFSQPGYCVHRDTLRVYRRLIDRGRSVRVFMIDEWALPWVQFRFRRKDGRIEYHSLAINHDGWVRVRTRRGGCSQG
jgi:hypothetical protein